MKASKKQNLWGKRHTCESSRKNSGGVTTKSPRSLPEEWDEEKFFSRASLARTDCLFPKLAKVSLLAGLILSDSLSLWGSLLAEVSHDEAKMRGRRWPRYNFARLPTEVFVKQNENRAWFHVRVTRIQLLWRELRFLRHSLLSQPFRLLESDISFKQEPVIGVSGMRGASCSLPGVGNR